MTWAAGARMREGTPRRQAAAPVPPRRCAGRAARRGLRRRPRSWKRCSLPLADIQQLQLLLVQRVKAQPCMQGCNAVTARCPRRMVPLACWDTRCPTRSGFSFSLMRLAYSH